MPTAILAARLAGCSVRVATNHVPTLGPPEHNLIGNSIYRMARRSLASTIFESRENLEIAVRAGCRETLGREGGSARRRHCPSSDPRTETDARRRLDLPPDAFVIGTVGRLEPQKAHDALVRALATIASLRPELDPSLVVVGDGSERGALERLVEDMGLRGRVRLLGHVEPVATLYPAFDVFALASMWEGLPLSLLEAMASGLAVVATDVGGVSDAIYRRRERAARPRPGSKRISSPLSCHSRMGAGGASLLGMQERTRSVGSTFSAWSMTP